MRKEGHLGLSLLLGSPVASALIYYGFVVESLLYLFIVSFFSSLPDIDIRLQKSALGDIFNITHRGITHTVWFGLLFGSFLGSTIYVGYEDPILTATIAFAGFSVVIFHSIGDMITQYGINYIPPLTDKIAFKWCNYNNRWANYGYLALGIISLFIVFLTATISLTYIFVFYGILYCLFVPFVTTLTIRYDHRIESRTHPIVQYFRLSYYIR